MRRADMPSPRNGSVSPATMWPGATRLVNTLIAVPKMMTMPSTKAATREPGGLHRAILPWRSSEPRFVPRLPHSCSSSPLLVKVTSSLIAHPSAAATLDPLRGRYGSRCGRRRSLLGPAAQGLDEAAGHPDGAWLVALDVDQVEPGQSPYVAMTHPDHASVDLGHKEGLVTNPLPCGRNFEKTWFKSTSTTAGKLRASSMCRRRISLQSSGARIVGFARAVDRSRSDADVSRRPGT